MNFNDIMLRTLITDDLKKPISDKNLLNEFYYFCKKLFCINEEIEFIMGMFTIKGRQEPILNIEILNRINECYHQKKKLFPLKCKYEFTLYYDQSRIGEFKCHAHLLKEAKRKLEEWIIEPNRLFVEGEIEFDEETFEFLERRLNKELEKKFYDNYLRGSSTEKDSQESEIDLDELVEFARKRI